MKYSKYELIQGLTTTIIGKKIFVFESIDSTNECARALGDAGTEEGAVVITDFQTNWRGRLGRTWEAEPESSLLFSVLLRPSISIERAGLLTLYASVALARVVEGVIGERVECKWPNDLILRGKKFCGILLENSVQQRGLAYAVIGAGLNVNQNPLPSNLAERAISLATVAGRSIDRKQLFQSVLGEMDRLYRDAQKDDFSFITAEWNRRCTLFGKSVTVRQHDRVISGTALRLNYDAGLVVKTTDGLQTVYAGDVTLDS